MHPDEAQVWMAEHRPRITSGISDPDQEHIDDAVAHMSPATLAEYERMSYTAEIREAYAHLDRETLESRLAFEWRGGIEKRVKLDAWLRQNHADKIDAVQKTAKASEGALAAMRHVFDLHRQGRKTVKIDDLLDLYREESQ